jgi:cytochrome c-type biogenesis protein CcmE
MDHPLQLDERPSPKRRAKFVAGGAVIAISVLVLVAWAMSRADAMAYYMTTSELVANGPTVSGDNVDVGGKVTADSIEQDGFDTTFTISDGTTEVVVATSAELPDAFRAGADVVAHGTFDGTTFTASEIVAKCPSKFKPASG